MKKKKKKDATPQRAKLVTLLEILLDAMFEIDECFQAIHAEIDALRSALAEQDAAVAALAARWSERVATICRTVDRCDSARAFEVQRCMRELEASGRREEATND